MSIEKLIAEINQNKLADETDARTILGIGPEVSLDAEVIQARYKKRALSVHPDKISEVHLKEKAGKAFGKLADAKEYLFKLLEKERDESSRENVDPYSPSGIDKFISRNIGPMDLERAKKILQLDSDFSPNDIQDAYDRLWLAISDANYKYRKYPYYQGEVEDVYAEEKYPVYGVPVSSHAYTAAKLLLEQAYVTLAIEHSQKNDEIVYVDKHSGLILGMEVDRARKILEDAEKTASKNDSVLVEQRKATPSAGGVWPSFVYA